MADLVDTDNWAPMKLDPSGLTPYDRNARTHSQAQVDIVCDSINEFGFINPIIIDEKRKILAGHARQAAAVKLGLDKVPCVKITGLSDTQKRAYVLADNRLNQVAGDWDLDILKMELKQLEVEEFNISIAGFDEDFVRGLWDEPEQTKHAIGERLTENLTLTVELGQAKPLQDRLNEVAKLLGKFEQTNAMGLTLEVLLTLWDSQGKKKSKA